MLFENSNLIDKVTLSGTVATVSDSGSPLGYSGVATITSLDGYPTGKSIVTRVPVSAYSGSFKGLITFPSSSELIVFSKNAANYTFVIEVLYKRG